LAVDDAAVEPVADVDPPLLPLLLPPLAVPPSTPPCACVGKVDLLAPAAALLNASRVLPLALVSPSAYDHRHGGRDVRAEVERGRVEEVDTCV
jgi:hypothetical protein